MKEPNKSKQEGLEAVNMDVKKTESSRKEV